MGYYEQLVQRYPARTCVLMALLIVAVIVLAVYANKYRGKTDEYEKGLLPFDENPDIGPQPNPDILTRARRAMKRCPKPCHRTAGGGCKCPVPGMEGMHSPPCVSEEYSFSDAGRPACLAPLEVSSDMSSAAAMAVCADGWTPAAVAEARGLTAAQATPIQSEAEDRLRDAIEWPVIDTELGNNSAKIARMMLFGNSV